jgi:hypothetical protein
MFDYKHIKTFNRAFADDPGPMVLFASPGMLHAGTVVVVVCLFSSSRSLVFIYFYLYFLFVFLFS